MIENFVVISLFYLLSNFVAIEALKEFDFNTTTVTLNIELHFIAIVWYISNNFSCLELNHYNFYSFFRFYIYFYIFFAQKKKFPKFFEIFNYILNYNFFVFILIIKINK